MDQLLQVTTFPSLLRGLPASPAADDDKEFTVHSDKPTGPTTGSETTDALQFLAWLTSHIPNKGQVLQRYYGFHSSRARASACD